MKPLQFLFLFLIALLVSVIISGCGKTDGPDWDRINAPPMLQSNFKVYIDSNSIVDGNWKNLKGKFCWVKLTDLENGKEVVLEYRAFFDKSNRTVVITECKTNKPKFTGKNFQIGFQRIENELSEDYIKAIKNKPWTDERGRSSLRSDFSDTYMIVQSFVNDVMFTK